MAALDASDFTACDSTGAALEAVERVGVEDVVGAAVVLTADAALSTNVVLETSQGGLPAEVLCPSTAETAAWSSTASSPTASSSSDFLGLSNSWRLSS